jgi:putative ABC transport system permease protein
LLTLRLLLKNAFRHKLRSVLTIGGLTLALVAYGLIDTVIVAWYANADATSGKRLITRSAISLMHPLPATIAPRIRSVPGVSKLTWLTWFGGSYGDGRQPFPKFAVDADSYLDLYPEYRLPAQERLDFQQDRQGVVIGPKLASTFGFKLGDSIPIKGDAFPGNWRFTVRGIYTPRDDKVDDTLMLIHWNLVADQVRQQLGHDVADHVAVFVVGIDDENQGSAIARQIDAQFRDSASQTRTETEKSYQLSIVGMSRNILIVIRVISIMVILIVMAVAANTMQIAASERLREYATLKALGFTPRYLFMLLVGESLCISMLAGALAVAFTYPASSAFVNAVGSLYKGFYVAPSTVLLQLGAAALVGVMAAAWPAWRVSRVAVARALST